MCFLGGSKKGNETEVAILVWCQMSKQSIWYDWVITGPNSSSGRASSSGAEGLGSKPGRAIPKALKTVW